MPRRSSASAAERRKDDLKAPVSVAPVTLTFSDSALERAFLLEDFRATKYFVPLFSGLVCAFSFVLVTAVPEAFGGWYFIYPMFLVIGLLRLLVQCMLNEARALQIYSWTWVGATASMFIGWNYAQRHQHLVTNTSVGFLAGVCMLLVFVSAYLRLLVGPFWPRTLTLLCYVVGWACTWPRISVVGAPGEPLVMVAALVLGHALSHAMERSKRCAFLRSQGREMAVGPSATAASSASMPRSKRKSRTKFYTAAPNAGDGARGAAFARDAAASTIRDAAAASSTSKEADEPGPAGPPGAVPRAPSPVCEIHRMTLEFSDAAVENDFLLHDFRQSHALVSAFCLALVILVLAFLVAFPSAWPAAFFTLPQFGIIGGVRMWTARLTDEARGMRLFCWTWLAVALGVFTTWVLAQRRYVLLSGLSLPCAYLIAVMLSVVSGFLVMLVGPFWPRTLTLCTYVLGWAATWPRVSVLGWPLEPLLMGSAVVLGGLLGHTWSHQRRLVHLAAQLEVRRQVEQKVAEQESAAEVARQQAALRFAEALRYINDVVIELRIASGSPHHIRQSVVTHCSHSFAATFGRENDGNAGLLFELVDPVDELELERLLCSAACGVVGGAVAATSSLTFLRPNGAKRRLQLQVVRLQQLSSKGSPASSPAGSRVGSREDLRTFELLAAGGSVGSSSHGSSVHGPQQAPLPLEPLSLFVVCHDLSDALRQAEREIEQKAHRVLNHTAKRVMANTSQCCRMVIEQLGGLDAATPEEARATVDGVMGLLRTALSESVSGYHFCRTAIVQAGIQSGEHTPNLETFLLFGLFDDLGFAHHSRVLLHDAVRVPLRADLQLVSCILFNAVHNALAHGEKGATVVVGARLEEGTIVSADDAAGSGSGAGDARSGFGGSDGGEARLGSVAYLSVTVSNRAGSHHAALKAMGVDDLLASPITGAALRQHGVGAEESTYLGLPEIVSAARMLRPPADVHLWVRENELPAGLIFVCCDDDDIPRIYANNVLLPAVRANADMSTVVGETYDEAVGVPDLVMGLAEKYGHHLVYGIFDQNLTNYDEGSLFGTGLCRELRYRGFRGTLVIQSANDEQAAEREYMAAGANGCVGKALRGGADELVRRLAIFWAAAAAAA